MRIQLMHRTISSDLSSSLGGTARKGSGGARRSLPAASARNVTLLALCQAAGLSCTALTITVGAVVGNGLAPNRAVATLPLALQYLAMMAIALPFSLLMRRYGRRFGFSLGAGLGCMGGVVGALAILEASFYLLCLSSILVGAFLAAVQHYRFAAAEIADDSSRSRAISMVLAGGLLAAFIGPQLADWTRAWFAPTAFAGAYLSIAILSLLSLALIQYLDMPLSSSLRGLPGGRPLSTIVRQPEALVAILSAMVGYGAMNLVMTATPIAMVSFGHDFKMAAHVIQVHMVAMYAPSFFTGHLIHRIGIRPILGLGGVCLLAAIAVNLSGVHVSHFGAALVLLGLGWNFLFVGGTTLLTECYRPEEKAKVQGLNDFLVFGTVACTALLSGAVFDASGWRAVNAAVVCPVIVSLAGVVWLGWSRTAPRASHRRLATFTSAEYRTTAAAAERILPRDEDPGAIDLGVPEYIDLALAVESLSDWRVSFRTGLARLDVEARAHFGCAFHRATAGQQTEVLVRWQQQGDDDARKFFELLKGLTFEGAFGDPLHGGNREGQGFRLVGWEPGRGECEPRA
jgi:MFS family permease